MLSSYRNQKINSANQLTGFYVMGTMIVKELIVTSGVLFTAERKNSVISSWSQKKASTFLVLIKVKLKRYTQEDKLFAALTISRDTSV